MSTEHSTPEKQPVMIEMPESMRRSLGERAAPQDYVLTERGTIPLSDEQVRGIDTSKVNGHPDNKTADMSRAYAESLDKRTYPL